MSKTLNKKIGIIGLGPVGMILAVHLKEAGCQVLICDHDRVKLNLIRNEGIKLENVITRIRNSDISTVLLQNCWHKIPIMFLWLLKPTRLPTF